MFEFIREAFSAHQLPATMVLGLVILYWLIVMIGGLDFDSSILDGGDLPDVHDVHHGPSALGGAWVAAGRLLGFAKVPVAVWGSFAVLFTWAAALLLNYYFNGEPGNRDFGRAALLFVPASIIGLVATKIVTLPVGKLFAAMADADTEGVEVIGKTGAVTTSTVDERYGQLQIATGGAPVLLNVRVSAGSAPLKKGDPARVLSASPDGSFYYVEAALPPDDHS